MKVADPLPKAKLHVMKAYLELEVIVPELLRSNITRVFSTERIRTVPVACLIKV
jgi:hypothetical protein